MTKNITPAGKTKQQTTSATSLLQQSKAGWLAILQLLIGLLIAAEVWLLLRGYYTSDAEMYFVYTAPIAVLAGTIFLSIMLKSWLRWLWVIVAALVTIAISLVAIVFFNFSRNF